MITYPVAVTVTPFMNRFSNFSILSFWNSNIREAVNGGHAQKALLLFRQMKQTGVTPNGSTFPFVAKACARISCLWNSQMIHAHIAKSCFQSNVFVQTAMVDMYMKCGHLEDAHHVFVGMPTRDIASWNAMLAGFSHRSFVDRFFCLLREMRYSGMHPDSVTVLLLIQSVLELKNPNFVNAVHCFAIRIGVHIDVSVANTLIAVYAKCGDLCSAEIVFDEIGSDVRSVISWNSMIAAYANFEKYDKAVDCYTGMLDCGLLPDISTILNLLSACVQPKALFQDGNETKPHNISCCSPSLCSWRFT
ncbi:pentatricopeptide repeat-containing protein At4g19191, mitochondrial-like isoform X2 [Arachis ipaensis]|uniref:pentatricopeptide repeat-containing protein At4g19191, mitochondrial-like isoform X2 n=1 Tax=Arachis ipaensis TaxID=130454 RepID=UPI000A2B9558|nr:pentatricopeptide repeat-containing protein At4g19191, mitochondrial-like isoform X2 [Arachis ipaensis]XP_025666790.1 pentatricopeptide repeat-containing protein At4g19191, mitochondrial-like [Arachis hypogaea]